MESPLTETLDPDSPQYQNGRLTVAEFDDPDVPDHLEWQVFGLEPRYEMDPEPALANKWLGQLGRQGWRLVQVDRVRFEADDDAGDDYDNGRSYTTYYFTRRIR